MKASSEKVAFEYATRWMSPCFVANATERAVQTTESITVDMQWCRAMRVATQERPQHAKEIELVDFCSSFWNDHDN